MKYTARAAALVALALACASAHAQSSDALLDKLVEKGIISVREANELGEQADEGFHKAYQAKTGLPDWVTQLKLYGDVRGRVELFRFDNDDRMRINELEFDYGSRNGRQALFIAAGVSVMCANNRTSRDQKHERRGSPSHGPCTLSRRPES